ncbi:MAG: DNA polymerase III subunit alpha [Pseudomonadota bacterium]
MTAPIRPNQFETSDAIAPARSLTSCPFVHLKVHSAYSLLEGALPIGKLAELATGYGFPAIALTDTGNLFGILEFSEKVSKAGIQPIAGISLSVDFGERADDRYQVAQPLSAKGDGAIALLAMSEEGYANLMKLASFAHFDNDDIGAPHVAIERLETHGAGLIALTGGADGPIDSPLREGQSQKAEARLKRLRKIFGDRLYVEMQRHRRSTAGSAVEAEDALLSLAYALELPLVATNEAYFATPSDYDAHDALLCIADGRYIVEDDRRRVTPEHYLKSEADMVALFEDLPEALENTVEIAKRCHYRPLGKSPILPQFVPAGDNATKEEQVKAEAEELARQAREGLAARLEAHGPAADFTVKDYDDRLAFELSIIEKMGFPGYFLIVADFIKWGKAQGIPVGPGRGSGAGSLVAYSLTITDLDPLAFGLLFERFLNPERISMPDFDIDFCQDRRDEVIKYVQQKYGHDRVAQIITHGKLQARAVLRDVGRVLQMPFGQVDRLCKLVPNNPANPVTLAEAIEEEPRLQDERDEDPAVGQLIDISLRLEGLYRHASTHAAGMVIGDRPLDELVPLYRDPRSNFPITQFNWKLVEAAGLVKFDFLGLKTLTVLQKAVALIKQGRGIDIDLASLPLDDEASYKLLADADTVGVFQLESTGMRESLKQLKPDRFDDIIAMVSLYRPGPMSNIPTYINRKHGREDVDCFHPMLEDILQETYGVIIYQEQVMQIAQVMAGYSLGKADVLRRAMGKKDKAAMAEQQAEFVKGAVANGVKEKDAADIFVMVDKFAGYGFNKSHAAAYALVAYHTAYLKANFREEFLAASMTLDMANTDKLAMFAQEARTSNIPVLPPCVNASEVEFSVEPPNGDGMRPIRYALAALKNVGESAVETVVSARVDGGVYADISDFAGRLNPKAVNRRALEMLSSAGAFDGFGLDRAAAFENAEPMLALANRLATNAADGIDDLFGGGAGGGSSTLDMRPARAWSPMERLDREFAAVGFFLSGHPLDEYAGILKSIGVKTFAEFVAGAEKGSLAGRIAGIVVSARQRKSQRGNPFAFAMFSDTTGQFEAVVFSDTLNAARDLLEPGTPVVVAIEADRGEGDQLKLRANGIQALEAVAKDAAQTLTVALDPSAIVPPNGGGRRGEASGFPTHEIQAALKPGKGKIRLALTLFDEAKDIVFELPGRYETSPAVRGQLLTLCGVVDVSVG